MAIIKDDVIEVMKQLNIEALTDDEIDIIVSEYPARQKEDLSATWELVVEQQIYEMLNNKN